MAKKTSNGIIDMMQEWFDKAPALPKNAREAIVRITPVLAIIFGVLGLLGSLAGLGFLTAFAPFAFLGGVNGYGSGFIAALFWLVSSVLLIAAFPGVRARKINGWNMIFWSELVSFAGSIISLSIVSGIIGALIAFYLLFQIKSYYK